MRVTSSPDSVRSGFTSSSLRARTLSRGGRPRVNVGWLYLPFVCFRGCVPVPGGALLPGCVGAPVNSATIRSTLKAWFRPPTLEVSSSGGGEPFTQVSSELQLPPAQAAEVEDTACGAASTVEEAPG